MTMGALMLPLRTRSLKRRPNVARSPMPSQQMRAGRSLERDALPRQRESSGAASHRAETARATRSSVTRDVLGIAGERDPAERSLALAEERADVSGTKPGMSNAFFDARRVTPGRGCCCRNRK